MLLPVQKNDVNEGVFDLKTIPERMNMRINCEVGLTKKYTMFTVEEPMQHIGVYMANGLNPSPLVNQKLRRQTQEPIQSCDLIANALGPSAEIHHKQFQRYLILNDPRVPVLPKS